MGKDEQKKIKEKEKTPVELLGKSEAAKEEAEHEKAKKEKPKE